MNQPRFCANSVLAMALVAAGGLAASSGCHGPVTADAAAQSGQRSAEAPDSQTRRRVTAGTPWRERLVVSTQQPARIEAFEVTPLVPKVAGYVEQVLVDIGDRVEKGQVLLRLAVPELQDDVRQKEAMLIKAQAQIEQAAAALVAAQAMVATAEAHVTEAEAAVGRADGEFERWNAEYERIRELAANGSVTEKLADETRNQWRAADALRREVAARVQSAKASLGEARANAARAEADLQAARANRDVAEADLARAQTMLDYCDLKAPFDGVVTDRAADTGQFVSDTAQAPLLVVVRTDKVRVFADIPELEAPLVDAGAQGDMAVVRVQALPGREFHGPVTRTSWALASSNRSLRVEIDLDNPDGILRSGMYATVELLLDERTDALVMPVDAIVYRDQGSYCLVVRDGRLDEVPIRTGLRSGDRVEVLSGIGAEDVVVLARAASLEPGEAVEVVEPEIEKQ